MVAGPHRAVSAFELGRSSVHRETFEVRPTAEPILFTVACAADEQLASGGFSLPNQPIHAVFSYPSDAKGTRAQSGEQAHAWTVGVINQSKTTQAVQVAAACLAGGDGQSSVQVVTETHPENAFTMGVDCPDGTTRSGGGYFWEWAPPKLALLAVNGSYPVADRRWNIDATTLADDPNAKAGSIVSAYAVCLTGDLAITPGLPTRLDVQSGQQDCGTFNQVAVCLVPRTGTQSVRCGPDEVLGGGGYHVTVGRLPGPYSVVMDSPAREGGWTIQVEGASVSPEPISLDVTALCLVAVVAPVPDDGTRRASWDWPVISGVSLAVLLLLVVMALALRRALRRPRSRDRQIQFPQLQVAVRASRSAYRPDEIREVQ